MHFLYRKTISHILFSTFFDYYIVYLRNQRGRFVIVNSAHQIFVSLFFLFVSWKRDNSLVIEEFFFIFSIVLSHGYGVVERGYEFEIPSVNYYLIKERFSLSSLKFSKTSKKEPIIIPTQVSPRFAGTPSFGKYLSR